MPAPGPLARVRPTGGVWHTPGRPPGHSQWQRGGHSRLSRAAGVIGQPAEAWSFVRPMIRSQLEPIIRGTPRWRMSRSAWPLRPFPCPLLAGSQVQGASGPSEWVQRASGGKKGASSGYSCPPGQGGPPVVARRAPSPMKPNRPAADRRPGQGRRCGTAGESPAQPPAGVP